ncbi:hypothetical protein [Hymenobacter negativus]|uniref:Uncharacterized protein n=1 Tax=Hymenobacter negativus TaxID=2795026 RepID=A0ABS3Q9M2_9BACT|nr:hypothetical protein [Hymenobacter negativus]MBO2007940.1 hypothetical protein [Hymenobacter negativus]
MKLPKALLGAIVVGVTVQATVSCSKKDAPTPKEQTAKGEKEPVRVPYNCPGCGMG